MPLPTSKKNAGLGHAIANRRAKESSQRNASAFHTTDFNRGLQSVTHQGDLEEFIATAQLAESDFTAERRNVTVVSAPAADGMRGGGVNARGWNPFLLDGREERESLERQRRNKEALRVPRRPRWDSKTTPSQLQRLEAEAFLDWRRSLAQLTDSGGFVLTPFERNLEVWRQLWRVVERSHLVVQIVDARNPLRFRCEDLEKYVEDIPARVGSSPADDEEKGEDEGLKERKKGPRRNLLLINKADLLDQSQRRIWAKYFEENGIRYAFFSAANAAAVQQERLEREMQEEHERLLKEEAQEAALREGGLDVDEEEQEEDAEDQQQEDEDAQQATAAKGHSAAKHLEARVNARADTQQARLGAQVRETAAAAAAAASALDQAAQDVDSTLSDDAHDHSDPTRVLNVLELEELFRLSAPPLDDFATAEQGAPSKLVVGLVGYPNVGKSSTINALLGEKKVSVSSTPGHTKHFQTINLSDNTVLCDCPGLVFPQFATTPADLVCDGVLPIDQMREYTAPAELIARRIPKDILQGTYSIRIEMQLREEGGSGQPTGLELLTSYAVARGFVRQGQGNPDESRAARYIFKDYVNARLLYAHAPPGVDGDVFNSTQREACRAALRVKRYAPALSLAEAEEHQEQPTGAGAGADGKETSRAARAKNDAISLAARKQQQGSKSSALDSSFFKSSMFSNHGPSGSGAAGHYTTKGRSGNASAALRGKSINDDGTPVTQEQLQREMELMSTTSFASGNGAGKKHFKANKRNKQRSGQGFA
ncbi:P-loop containing nucleoside triphosphate hydrolase protein [Ceraceosorus guamensis]|uniref:P-loop containing nucleoside triphosphate hydrolase protein n=1 Tax=Ceraceosorus guamensis TaxID=1522189 RepID=A0A316W3L2_9BASI|nr:P-loop containing nucleoside triphosphate hydrolase protein [Ceraceosorus guamensis]PWN44487.1 P-loop containing nucleoside triphosphate hydrolase protein [Ceraceosorus guamensis]